MNLSKHDFKSLGIVWAVVICLWAVYAVCGCASPTPLTTAKAHANPVNKLFRCEFEGHQWIVLDGYHAGALIHHPDCPCQKEIE